MIIILCQFYIIFVVGPLQIYAISVIYCTWRLWLLFFLNIQIKFYYFVTSETLDEIGRPKLKIWESQPDPRDHVWVLYVEQ